MQRLIFFLFIMLPSFLEAQNSWQDYYELLTEYEEDEDETQLSLIYDALSEVAENPFNLNAVSKDDLEAMMCFSDRDIDAILEYVNHYGPVRTKAEILMIPYLDDARRGLLSTLCYLGEMPPRKMNELDSLQYANAKQEYSSYFSQPSSKGEFVAYTRVPFYLYKGFKETENGKPYSGGRLKHWIRMNYRFNRHMKIGFVASQDAGEPFFKGKNKSGYDFCSYYVQLQKLGLLKNIVVGKYRLRTGLGLVLNNNFSFGKTFSLSSALSSRTSILPHSSRSDANYLQGVAATLGLTKNLEATAFASYRKIDATLTSDSLGIATILRTGYHRTQSELARKDDASQTVFGGNIKYSFNRFHIGATYVFNHYSIPLRPYIEGSSASQLYKLFNPTGYDFWNSSVDYGYKMGKQFVFEGETATGTNGHIATINTLSWRQSNHLTINAIQRFYPYRFWSTMGRGFSEGGTNQDESGIYVGAIWNANARWSMTAYTDIAYFAWPKYQALGSSHSFDTYMQVSYHLATHTSLNIRYRIKLRQKDADETGKLIYKDEQRLRLSLITKNGRWSWKSQIDGSYCKYKEQSAGLMISQTIGYELKRLKLFCGASYFNTKDYNARVYAYEQSTPYSLSFPSLYGKGIRGYVLADYALIDKLSLTVKLASTHYFDRNVIGSSYQQIDGSTQTDLDIMLRWKF